MDPADSQRSLTNTIRQHEESIQIAHQNVAALARSVGALVQQMSHLASSGATAGSGEGGAAAPSGSSHACDPEPFDGDLSKCRGFLLQCRLVFAQRPHLFTSDSGKINYIIGLLRGRALAWAQASSGAHLNSLPLEAFIKRFERVFDRPDYAGCAGDRLFTLRQGARSVAEFVVEFETLAAESGWNEPALLCAFRRGLNDQVRDALVAGARPRDLAEMIDRTIELDNYQRERRRDRLARSVPFRPSARRRLSPPFAPALPGDPRPRGEEPMQLGGALLSPSERRRRRASNACFCCGQAGHFVASCPVLLKEHARQQE